MMQAANRETDKKHNPPNPTTPKSCQIYVSPKNKKQRSKQRKAPESKQNTQQESPDFAFNTGGDP